MLPENQKTKLLVLHVCTMKEPRLASLPRSLPSSGHVTNHLKEYRDGGLPFYKIELYRVVRSFFVPCLRCDFLIRPVADAKEAVQRIEARGCGLSESRD